MGECIEALRIVVIISGVWFGLIGWKLVSTRRDAAPAVGDN